MKPKTQQETKHKAEGRDNASEEGTKREWRRTKGGEGAQPEEISGALNGKEGEEATRCGAVAAGI